MEAPVNMILQIQETPASALTVKKLEGLLGATTKDKLRSVIAVAQVVFVGCLAYYAGRKLSQIIAKKSPDLPLRIIDTARHFFQYLTSK